MGDETNIMQQSDHDTLIRVHSQLQSLTDEIRNSNSNTLKVIADHEARIRSLENTLEISKGTSTGVNNNRRTVIEIIGVIAAAVSAYATFMLGKAH